MKAGCLLAACCIAAVVAVAPHVSTADDKSHPQAEKLLADALQFGDIRAPGSTPFRLKARFLVNKDKNHSYEGTYLLEWSSPTSWRGELKTASYTEIRVAHGDHLFISRDPSNPIVESFQVLQLLNFPPGLDRNPSLKVEKLLEKRSGGSLQRVIEISVATRPWIKVYLDGSRPEISRIEYKGAMYGSHYPFKDFENSSDFRDYKEFHGHQFPQTLSYRNSGILLEQVEILELTDAVPGTRDFDPPPDSHWIRWCAHPQLAKLDPNRNLLPLMPPPQFRPGAPRLHAAIYGIIGTDGVFHNLTVLESAGELVDSYFEKQLVRLRFTPAQCDGTPVETEEIPTFEYP